HPALIEDDMLLRIDAGSEEGGGDLARLVGEIVIDHLRGQRMQVDDAVDAVVGVLQGDELADGAEIIAEMEISGGLDAREDELPERRGCMGHFKCPWLVEGRSSMARKLQAFRTGHAAGNRRGEISDARLMNQVAGAGKGPLCVGQVV